MFITIGKVATMIGVSITTLRRWDTNNTFRASHTTVGGHRRYSITSVLAFIHKEPPIDVRQDMKSQSQLPVVTYTRVSSAKQKEDLERQEEHVKAFARQNCWDVVQAYRDIGSGLNDTRKGLLRMLLDLPVIQPAKLLISYPDRLARFGTTIIKTICSMFNTEVICTHTDIQEQPLDQQLTGDIIAMLTSFAGKLHRSRRGKQDNFIDPT